MNYTRRIDTDKAVEMQISSFTGKGGTTEYQVMVYGPLFVFRGAIAKPFAGLCDCREGRAIE
mgnify:FL=1